MAAKKTTNKKADKAAPAPSGDNQQAGEDPFAYVERRKRLLSNDGDKSSYTDSEVPNLVIQERGPAA